MQRLRLKPALLGGASQQERTLAWFLYGSRACREGPWKLVWGVTSGRWELYNMDEDRTETRDLAKDKPAISRRLADTWMDWAKLTGAPSGGTRDEWYVL